MEEDSKKLTTLIISTLVLKRILRKLEKIGFLASFSNFGAKMVVDHIVPISRKTKVVFNDD
jgi:hypothetical protein